MLIPLLGFAVLLGAYFVARSQLGSDSVVVSGLRIVLIACLMAPICMLAAAIFTDFKGEQAGKGVVFGAVIAGVLVGVIDLPGFRSLMTRQLGRPKARPTTSSPETPAVPWSRGGDGSGAIMESRKPPP